MYLVIFIGKPKFLWFFISILFKTHPLPKTTNHYVLSCKHVGVLRMLIQLLLFVGYT